MSKLKVLSSALTEITTIESVLSSSRTEVINADNTLSFSMVLTDDNKDLINDTNVIGLDGDYFDIAKYKNAQSSNGDLTVSVECEHISYRLNNSEYDKDTFTELGTPTYILGQILSGTGFTVGTVDFTKAVTYSAQQAMSRRGLLVQFAEMLGGELLFDGLIISILAQRGSATAKDLMAGRNIEVISKTVDKTTLDDFGNPTISYECSLINPMSLALGDIVTMAYAKLGINVSLRIVSITTNPYNQYEVSFSVSNTVTTVEDAAYKIATMTVSKDVTYNGCKIGPENGFEAIRNDKLARSYFNGSNFSMQAGDGSGTNWTDKIYFDSVTGKYVFDGELSADVINALSVLISPSIYTDKANIGSLTVDELSSSDAVKKYLETDTTNDNYVSIYDQWMEYITATTDGLDANKVQITDRDGHLLYWTDETHKAASTTVTVYPVYTFAYVSLTKLKLGFRLDPGGSGFQIPVIELGAGTGVDNNGKSFIYEGLTGLYLDHYSSTDGSLRRIIIGDNGIVLTPYYLESIDFYDNGFSAKYSGETVAYTWTTDANGVITELVTEDLVTIPVTWHTGDM